MHGMIERSRPSLTFSLAKTPSGELHSGEFARDANTHSPRGHAIAETWFDTPDARLRAAGLVASIVDENARLTRRLGLWPGQYEASPWPEAPVEGATLSCRDLPDDFRKMAGLSPDDGLLIPTIEFTGERWPRALERAGVGVNADILSGRIEAGGAGLDVHEARVRRSSGRLGDVFAAARAFQSLAPMRVEFATHAEKGALLLAGQWGAPVGKIQPDLRAGMNVTEAFVAIAHACLRQFSLNAPAFNSTHQVEAVHQTRVAIRRLRSALSLFAPVLRDAAFDHLRAELKWLFDVLGAARDLDVLLDNPALATPDQRADLSARARVAHAAAAEAVASPRVDRLLFDLAEWIATGAWRRARAPRPLRDRGLSIGRFAARRLDRRHLAVTRGARRFDDLTESELHALRVEVKKLRYMVEFLEPLAQSDKARRRFGRGVRSLAALQETLGQIHDIDMGSLLLAGHASATDAALPIPSSPADRGDLLKRARREARAVVAAKPFWSLI